MVHPTFQAKQVTRGVLRYLERSQQLHLLPQIAEEARRSSRAHVDPHRATITSAVALSDASKKQLESTVSQLFDRQLTFEFSTDEALIAGLVIKVGDQVIDQSLSTQINQLTQSIAI